jgi:hypothetical protein
MAPPLDLYRNAPRLRRLRYIAKLDSTGADAPLTKQVMGFDIAKNFALVVASREHAKKKIFFRARCVDATARSLVWKRKKNRVVKVRTCKHFYTPRCANMLAMRRLKCCAHTISGTMPSSFRSQTIQHLRHSVLRTCIHSSRPQHLSHTTNFSGRASHDASDWFDTATTFVMIGTCVASNTASGTTSIPN